jgi:hypothetical protein
MSAPAPVLKCRFCGALVKRQGMAPHEKMHMRRGDVAGQAPPAEPRPRRSLNSKPDPAVSLALPIAPVDSPRTTLKTLRVDTTYARCFHCQGILLVNGGVIEHVETLAAFFESSFRASAGAAGTGAISADREHVPQRASVVPEGFQEVDIPFTHFPRETEEQ